jgi:hypothetical protein
MPKRETDVRVLSFKSRIGQLGSLKYAHHLGRAGAGTLGEQLILQEFVTHSINPALLAIEGAADFAAGDRLGGIAGFGTDGAGLADRTNGSAS